MTASAGGAGRPLDLWGQRGWHGQEVAGESHYTKEIRKLFGRQLKQEGEELYLTAQLVPEPHNRHDRNAVSVRINGMTVGYLPREDAARYAPVLSAIIQQGWFPQVSARVWGGDRTRYDYDRRGRVVERTEFVGSVRLDLAEPHLLAPMNHPPADAHALLPHGNAIQVTGEEEHLPTLMPLLSPAGECWIHATLHEVMEQTARTAKTLVEVRVDGGVVGRLTPKMSGELLPVIRHLAERGTQAVARAILKGNSVKADVVLYVARANQISQEWLDAPPIQGAPRQVTAVAAVDSTDPGPAPYAAQSDPAPTPAGAATPHAYGVSGTTAWRFNPPPGWPPPPPGWSPPPGWRPDPSWPPAPPDWQFWIAV
jgi:hypothetical protein